MSTIQSIYYTSRTAEWHAFARDLGLVPAFEPGPDWAEFDGDGILAIHHAEEAPRTDRAGLHVLVDDLDAVEKALRTTGVDVDRSVLEDVGSIITVRAAEGVEISASAGRQTGHEHPLRLQPIWYREDGDQAVRVFQALGLREWLRSDAGTWIEYAGDGGGIAAFHQATHESMSLGFQYDGNLDAFADRLIAAGHEASIVDEAYNRTLLVRTPDGWTLWINGPITDLYGYQRVTE